MGVIPGGSDAVSREGLGIPLHDYIENSYTDGNLTETVYKRGGSSGKVVATVTMTYDGSDKLLTVTRT